ncbi:MAG: MFS transporter [Candidatus Brocadiia bacterium]|jgi:sugar phosphate permease|nr:MFS transporter [Candidatus Brocadiia bacterium]
MEPPTDTDEAVARWRRRTLATLWITYAASYLGRQNLPAALTAIRADTGLDEAALGQVGAVFFLVYGVGQFINGLIGDRVGARGFIALALFASALLNIAFGFASSLGVMMIVWGANAYFLSIGWNQVVKTTSRWFPPRMWGKAGGVLSTCYVIGKVGALLLAGWIAQACGWRNAFFVPGVLLLAFGAHALLRIRNSPEEVGLPAPSGRTGPAGPTHRLGLLRALASTFGNARLLLAGATTFWITAVVYALEFWAPTYLYREYALSVRNAAWLAAVVPVAGAVGMVAGGWASDHLSGGRRGPIVSLGAGGAGLVLLTAFVLPGTRVESLGGVIAAWALVGALAYAAHGLLMSAVCMEVAGPGATATAAGFMGVCAYTGASVSSRLVGQMLDAHGWQPAFALWAGAALCAAVFMVPLWGFRAHRGSPA